MAILGLNVEWEFLKESGYFECCNEPKGAIYA